jgi:hypothetical protein
MLKKILGFLGLNKSEEVAPVYKRAIVTVKIDGKILECEEEICLNSELEISEEYFLSGNYGPFTVTEIASTI